MTDANVTQPPIWRLRADHYLNTEPQCFFIQRSVDGESGEQVEHRYPVPRLLQITDPKACNAGEGVILVSTDKAAKLINSRIWIFNSEPTPDMEPQNEAAEAITAKYRDKWMKPFEELNATGGNIGNFSASLEAALARILDAAGGKSTAPTGALPSVVEGMQKQIAELTALVEKLTSDKAPAEAADKGARRA